MDSLTVYQKSYDTLDDDEKEVWHEAYRILAEGNRLYGTTKEDTTHIAWAIQQAIGRLLSFYETVADDEYAGGLMLLELGFSPDGLFISVVPKTVEQIDPDDIIL